MTVTGIFATGADSGNYFLNVSAVTAANITAATLTVTANDTNRPYGTLNPAFTVRYDGFVNGEDTNVLSGSPVLSTLATTNSPVGVYPIQISRDTLSSANYFFILIGGNLTIVEVPSVLTISYVTGTGGQTNQVNLYSAGLAPGGTYHVQASADLQQWDEIATTQSAPDGTLTYTDADVPSHPIRFYRLSSN